jgi:hypothetical protein
MYYIAILLVCTEKKNLETSGKPNPRRKGKSLAEGNLGHAHSDTWAAPRSKILPFCDPGLPKEASTQLHQQTSDQECNGEKHIRLRSCMCISRLNIKQY